MLNQITFIERVKKNNPKVNVTQLTETINQLSQVSIISILLNYERFRCDGNGTLFKTFVSSLV